MVQMRFIAGIYTNDEGIQYFVTRREKIGAGLIDKMSTTYICAIKILQ